MKETAWAFTFLIIIILLYLCVWPLLEAKDSSVAQLVQDEKGWKAGGMHIIFGYWFFRACLSRLLALPAVKSLSVSVCSWNWRNFNNRNDNDDRRAGIFVNELLPHLPAQIFALQEHKGMNDNFFSVIPENYAMNKTKIYEAKQANYEGYVFLRDERRVKLLKELPDTALLPNAPEARPVAWRLFEIDTEWKVLVGNFHAPFAKDSVRQAFQTLAQIELPAFKDADIVLLATDGNLGLTPGLIVPGWLRLLAVPTSIRGKAHDTFFLYVGKEDPEPRSRFVSSGGVLVPKFQGAERTWTLSPEGVKPMETSKEQKDALNLHVSDHCPLLTQLDLFTPFMLEALDSESPHWLNFRLGPVLRLLEKAS